MVQSHKPVLPEELLLEPDRRYTTAELVKIAEEEIRAARAAANSHIPGAAERIQHWTDTLRILEITQQWEALESVQE